jgi:hypothetical protein
MTRRWWPWAFSCALLVGCSTPNLDVDPLVVPGTGETEFIPLTSGLDDVEMASGVQGGTHIWGAARATGMDWTDLTIEWTLTDADDEEVTEPTGIRQRLQPCTRSDAGCEPGMGEIVAVTLVLDDPSGVRGDELTLTLIATYEEGRSATAATQVRPINPVVID